MALAIFVYSFFPNGVSEYFSFGLFKYIGGGLRSISGIASIPLGEYVYLFIVIILIIKLLEFLFKIKYKFNSTNIGSKLFIFSKKIAIRLVQIYVVFMLLWGLNYRKSSPANSFHLKIDTSYSEAQLDSLSLQFIEELNNSRRNLSDTVINKLNYKKVFETSIQQYKEVQKAYTFIHLEKPVLKKAHFPSWGDYFGYLAFYQPITGEAIIRTDVPPLTLPYTTCHELAHQMGYASEAEANFIAFIVASKTNDPVLKYSMLLQLFTYCQSEQLNLIAKTSNFQKWKTIVSRNKSLLDPKIIADRKKIKDFFIQRQHLLIPASTSLYDQFLQWNKQAKGINSYDEVLLWVIAYKNQSGK
ncbi:MAG: DUF3810 family protein [Chitinophagia bacterium]|jgi:hypothetical protein|nr:DUF3810 family protein [Chitinophagia bacterium]